MNWVKTSERLPDRVPGASYSQVPCLVWDTKFKEVRILVFNHDHECWDDEDGDDYECDIERCSHWMPLPQGPDKAPEGRKEVIVGSTKIHGVTRATHPQEIVDRETQYEKGWITKSISMAIERDANELIEYDTSVEGQITGKLYVNVTPEAYERLTKNREQ